MAEGAVVTVIIVLVVCLFFIAVGLFLFYLHWRNTHEKPFPFLHKKMEDKKVKIALFILKDIVIPVIGLVFFIITIIGLQNDEKWGDLDMKAIEIAFYFFQSLKYAIVIFAIVSEHFEELDDKITIKLARIGIRADWKELIEGFIFIPNVIVDGMLINAEFYVGDAGDAFDGDGIVLLVIDTLLWIKLCNSLLLRQYSQKGSPPFQVKEFAYALVIFYYTVILVFFFIVEHQRVINISRMDLTTTLIIILVNALTHAYVCSYTSMMAQGITMFDKALRGSQARVTQLQLFIKIAPIPIFFNVIFMGWTVWVYVSVWIYTMNGHNNLQDEDESIQGLIRAVYILTQIFTGFLCINLAQRYAMLKRLGGYFNINITVMRQYKFPDCSSYANKINSILSQCTANFHLDHRAQVVVTSSPRSPPPASKSRK